MSAPLVLSLFPGIGLLDMAFEEAGFCVVRGPDLLWGGDVRRFHPPVDRFDGVIGGPPCPSDSDLGNFARGAGQDVESDYTPEFRRIVRETMPAWYLREGLRGAPHVTVPTYAIDDLLVNNRWFGAEQNRVRKFSIGVHLARYSRATINVFVATVRSQFVALDAIDRIPCVTANATVWDSEKQRPRGDKSERYFRGTMLRAQGLPGDFLDDAPLTVAGKIKVVGNGVPLPMGRAVAQAVKAAIYPELSVPSPAAREG